MDDIRQALAALGTLLDGLAVLRTDLSCECEVPDRLILPAARVRETCAAIEEAVPVLKAVLVALDERAAQKLARPPSGTESHAD